MDNEAMKNFFISQLSGAGASLDPQGPAGSINAITQQYLGAQSKAKLNQRYMKMMGQIMGGEHPTGSKQTIDDKGMKIEFPAPVSDPNDDTMSMGDSVGSIAEGLRAGAPQPGSQFGQVSTNRSSFLNPSPSPESGADFAGLTAADVSQALSGAVGVQTLKQKTLTDISDMTYKNQLMRESNARIRQMEKVDKLDQPFVGGLSLREYKSLTASTKEYVLAKEGARLLGDKEFMSQREWETLEPTEREKFVRAAMKDPRLMKAAKELARSGATRISLGEKKAGAIATAEGKQEAKFTDPEYVPKIEARIQKAKRRDPRRAAADTRAKEIQEKYGMSPEAAMARAQEEWARDLITKDLKVHYRGKEVAQKSDGWYVDGVLVMENPYAK